MATSAACDDPRCPCGRANRLVVAEAAETPVDCPNRLPRIPSWSDRFRRLASHEYYITNRAARHVSDESDGGATLTIADLVTHGRLVLLRGDARRPALWAGGSVETRDREVDPGPGPEPPRTETWIKIKVVDDQSGEPIPGVAMFVRDPNGNEREYTTRADGVIELNDIEPGAYEARCDLEGARLDDTLDFVVMGDTPSGATSEEGASGESGGGSEGVGETAGGGASGGGGEQEPASGSRIAEIEEHQVQTDETLQSVAETAGLTWQQLAEFNWGTTERDEINRHLSEDVGCTRRGDDGFMAFDANDDPGVIYVPSVWTQSGLATEAEHVVRVRSLSYTPATVECVCIPGVTFEFDKSFIRPSVVDHMAEVDDRLRASPDSKLIVWGHTDRVGNDQYNKDLSDRRAKSTYAFITDQPDIWEELYNDEGWGLAIIQTILADLDHDPGPIDGVMGPQTRTAMRSFLGLGGDAPVQNDASFRKQLFLAYMTGKHDVRVADERFAPPKYMGCGEFNPFIEPNEAELANRRPGNEPNRRVVLYLFNRPPRNVPCLLHDMSPCRTEIDRIPDQRADRGDLPVFRCAFYDGIAVECSCEMNGGGETATAGILFMQLFDAAGKEKLAGRSYSIVSPDDASVSLEGTLDAEGKLRHENVQPGDYELTVDGVAETCAALVLAAEENEPQIRYLEV